MQTKTYNVYTYDELNKKQQQKVLENLYDINIDYDWWDFVECDGSQVKLESFDYDHGKCSILFENSAPETALAILKNHGATCDTYKTSNAFMIEYNKEQRKPEGQQEIEALEREYQKDLSYNYLKLLMSDYEYRTSEEAIVKTIQANEYMFTENGKID